MSLLNQDEHLSTIENLSTNNNAHNSDSKLLGIFFCLSSEKITSNASTKLRSNLVEFNLKLLFLVTEFSSLTFNL